MIKSNPIPTRWVAHKQETEIAKKFSHYCKSSEPHVRLLSLGIQQKELGIPRESELKGQQDLITGLPQDWGEIETPTLESTNKMLCAPRPRGKKQ